MIEYLMRTLARGVIYRALRVVPVGAAILIALAIFVAAATLNWFPHLFGF